MELTQEEIIIGTEVIGEFMDSLTVDMHGNIKEDLTSFKYHSSWNDLMPVVEKIESLGYVVNIKQNTVFMQNNNKVENCMHGYTVEKSKKVAIYKAVIQFIKWYNQQK